jgi:hypothetical protein
MICSPVVLFVYNRLEHTKQTIEALQKNTLAFNTDLIIFSDAARSFDQQDNVCNVRSFLETIDGFLSLTIHYRPFNYGLAKSIIEGVSEVLNNYERIIVLEDDLITSPHFLAFMNAALIKYEYDYRVCCIHGYVYPLKAALPETFFLRGAECWGWATWRHGWRHFNPNGQYLMNELNRRNLIDEFNFNGSYSFSGMLQDQIDGRNDSWAVRWYASAFLADKLTLYPGRSLVNNIGMDDSGTHCGKSNKFESKLSQTPVNLLDISISHSDTIYHLFAIYFNQKPSRLLRYIKMCLKIFIPFQTIRIIKTWL